MLLYILIYIFTLIFLVNKTKATFSLDFNFIPPEYDYINIITTSVNNESLYNNSFLYYYHSKPMVKICLGQPLQCFLLQISFHSYETILNLNLLNFNYHESSSFNLLSSIDDTIAASDNIKIGNETKISMPSLEAPTDDSSSIKLEHINVRLYNNELFSDSIKKALNAE